MKEEKIKINLKSIIILCILFFLLITSNIISYLKIIKLNNKILEYSTNHTQTITLLKNEITILEQKYEDIQKQITLQNQNTTNVTTENTFLGTYKYIVPKNTRDEMGQYYDSITIELRPNNTFYYYYGEGSFINGVFEKINDNIICTAQTIQGEYLEEQNINVTYTYKYSNNTLELIDKVGKIKFKTSNMGDPNAHTEFKEVIEVHEDIGSLFKK